MKFINSPFRFPFPRMETFYEIGTKEPLHAYVTSYGEPHAGERNFRNIYPITPETHPKHHPVFDVFEKMWRADTKKGVVFKLPMMHVFSNLHLR
jgi:hypothetical protein